MPYMFIFPIVTIIFGIALWKASDNSNTDYYQQNNKKSEEKDTEDFIFYNMFFNNRK